MKRILIGFILLVSVSKISAQVTVANLLCENLSNPLGLGIKQPRFSWQLVSDKRNTMQTAYEVKVMQGKTVAWNSGKLMSDQSVFISYGGSALQSGKKYNWQVRVWDNEGKASTWSEPAWFQMALLDTMDWKANWIEPGFAEEASRPTPLFRKEFKAAKKIQSATAYITSHGMYEGYINGKRIGEYYLTPGWTSYNKRLQYQTYDVTNLLSQGANVIAMGLGNGWYRGSLAWGDNKNLYGKDISLLFQLDIIYSDGSKESVLSDGSWKSTTGSITYSEIYNGEIIDARKQKTGWRMSGYDDSNWSGVKVSNYKKSNLIACENEPIKKHETFTPVKIFTTPKGEQVIDFGQNLVGWVMIKAKGNAGDTITISHAEVLDRYGNFYTENLRAAKALAKYVLRGEGEESFEPHFTFFGFRYIRIENYPGELKPENFTAVALYSNMKPTGSFSSSNALINQLQHNIQWGQRGNFLDVPTDCPQRDERLGWTGDAQAFSRTAAFNFGVNNFFAKWLKDAEADQYTNGALPHVIPNVLGQNSGGSAGWADAATIIPWNMWLAYGDKKILENQYNSMKAWVGFMEKNSTDNLWNKGFHFGDWLFYRPYDDNDGRSAVTDKYLIAQCFYAHSTRLVIRAAGVLNKKDDEKHYTDLLNKIKQAFLKEYVTPGGRLVSSTQTAYVLALNFDMLPEAMRPSVADKLVENIKSYGTHLTTGFLGTPYLCHVLSRFGHTDLAYELLLQETYPSWLYPVKMGATTIWERWNGIRPDSTFEPASMNSFNHYAYGAIGDWMYRIVCGIDTDEDNPGYKKIEIQPHIGKGLTNASASLKTYYGTISSSWKKENDGLVFDVEIPPNTTATIYVPAENGSLITESGKLIGDIKEIEIKGAVPRYLMLKAGSGKYHFEVKK
ncbi:MAG: alpha-L-rhamnosidase [Bacteroidetes bacterium]|nr:MAG: alpha-L-rhamnosidase [Bacteroidota bacterium]